MIRVITRLRNEMGESSDKRHPVDICFSLTVITGLHLLFRIKLLQ